ncbi:mitochondrial large subunit ribosomal protein domain-containing protein [Trichoderma aethiopicum]
MSYLIPRALPLRSAITRPLFQSPLTSSSRTIFRPATPAASFSSTKPSSASASPRQKNPNQKAKVPPHLRQLSRAPVPPPTKTPEELVSLGYIVRRTPSVQLPVYRRWQSGGTRQVVVIKKVDGDRIRLLEDLVGGIGIAREDARVNPTTQHIELKGDHFDKARGWLLERGF